MTRAERCSIITLGNRDMAESKTFKQMAAACFKSLLEQNIHYSLLNKTAAGTIMSPHYAGTQGQVGSGKIQAHTHTTNPMAHLGKDGVTLPLIHHSCRLALTGMSSPHLIPFSTQRELTAACCLVDPKGYIF